MKLITVIIPTYNGEGTIKGALESIRNNPNFCRIANIVVVDDNSSDGTVLEINSCDLELNLLIKGCAESRGAVFSRNLALNHITTPFVINLDQDDQLDPSGLGGLEELFKCDSVPDCLFFDVVISQYGVKRHIRPKNFLGQYRWLNILSLLIFPPPRFGSTIISAEILRRVGGFGKESSGGEEWILFYRLARAGAKFAYVPQVILNRFEHQSNVSRVEYDARQYQMIRKALATVESFPEWVLFRFFSCLRMRKSKLCAALRRCKF